METLDAFMPHGMCYLWRPEILLLHAGSDLLIALSYFSIPAALLTFLRRREDIDFPPIFKLFIAFILACGVTHLLSIVVIWEPVYVAEGVMKLATGLISAATAFALWPLIPRALEIPNPRELEERNERIEALNQELASRVESLSTLAGGVAHDFNNLLTVITGHADLMASARKEPPRAEHLRAISDAAARASGLCQRMLAYSGRGHFVLDNGNLDDCIDPEALSHDRTVELRADLAGDLPAIRLASEQIHELVEELVRNAIEAAVESGVEPGIEIVTRLEDLSADRLADARFEHELRPGPAVVLEISDNGPGMDATTQTRLFDPYFSTRFVGRGLGMAAVQGIVRGHGAAFFLDASPTGGARITIAFPIARADTEAFRPRSAKGIRRMLVIDDETALLELATRYCRRLGIEALTTADPDEGIEILLTQGSDIDAVLLDYLMPLRTGDDVLAEIREFSGIDVYLSSGMSRGRVDDPELRAELAGFLKKPYGFEDFRALFAPE